MDINDLHPPDDYSHRFFIWHEWIQANGPLSTENVFEYFTTSMFYDKQSNNQVLRMQTMHTGMPILNEAEELKRFTGIEFALVHSHPPSLFIIHKRERLSPDEVRPLVAYFIMNNRIYQSPDVYTVLSNRLLTSLYSLQTSLDVLRSHRPDYTPRAGFIWPIVDLSITDGTMKKRDSDTDADGDIHSNTQSDIPESSVEKRGLPGTLESPKKQQNNRLLFNAMRATAVHSQLSFLSSNFAPAADSVTSGTPAHQRLSPTPTPGLVQESLNAMPREHTPSQEVPAGKGLPGAGKKKRKST